MYDQKIVNVVIFYCTFLQAQVLLQRRPTPLFIELRVEQLYHVLTRSTKMQLVAPLSKEVQMKANIFFKGKLT